MLRLSSERGDTIVEVMVSLAVLALAFSISFATANHSLLTTRNAQEHAEALQYLASQVEFVRSDSPDSRLYSAGTFCMDPANGALIKPVTTACTINPIGYQLTIVYSPASAFGVNQDEFTFDVSWPGVGSVGQQHEELQYKVHQL